MDVHKHSKKDERKITHDRAISRNFANQDLNDKFDKNKISSNSTPYRKYEEQIKAQDLSLSREHFRYEKSQQRQKDEESKHNISKSLISIYNRPGAVPEILEEDVDGTPSKEEYIYGEEPETSMLCHSQGVSFNETKRSDVLAAL